MGDLLLQEVAKRLATCTRDDFVTAITTNALIAPPKEVNP